jgi:hypothetical protein
MDCSAAPAQNVNIRTSKKNFSARSHRNGSCEVFDFRAVIDASANKPLPQMGMAAHDKATVLWLETPHMPKAAVDAATTKIKPQQ